MLHQKQHRSRAALSKLIGKLSQLKSSPKARRVTWIVALIIVFAMPPVLYVGFAKLVAASGFGFTAKILAAVAAAGFGILGVGATTREPTGELNTKGRIALSGIVVAAVFALASAVNDFISGDRPHPQLHLRRMLRPRVSF